MFPSVPTSTATKTRGRPITLKWWANLAQSLFLVPCSWSRRARGSGKTSSFCSNSLDCRTFPGRTIDIEKPFYQEKKAWSWPRHLRPASWTCSKLAKHQHSLFSVFPSSPGVAGGQKCIMIDIKDFFILIKQLWLSPNLTLFKFFWFSYDSGEGADLSPPSKNGGNEWEVQKLSWICCIQVQN